MKKTKLLTLTLLVMAMLFATMGAMVFAQADESQEQQPFTFANHTWENTANKWVKNEDDSVYTNNTGFTGNFLITTDDNLYGDYAVEATFKGTDASIGNEVDMGISPWFVDGNNFVVVFLKYNAETMHPICAQIIWYENGNFSGWPDHWLDYNPLYAISKDDDVRIRIEKTYDAMANADHYKVTISCASRNLSESPIDDINIAFTARHSAYKAKVGLYGMNDTITVSNFLTESLTDTGVYKKVGNADASGRTTSLNRWNYLEDAYVVDSTVGTSLQNQAVLPNTQKDGNYKISYTANISGNSNAKEASIMPYYADEDNFVRFVLRQTETGATMTAEGKIGGTALSEQAQTVSNTINWSEVSLSASKVGTNFKAYIGTDVVATYSNETLLDGANVGMGAGNGSAVFNDVEIEALNYTSYDWYFENGYYISANTQDSVYLNGETGAIVMNSPAESTNYTRLYKPSNKYNQVFINGEFTTTTGEYGLYINYTSETQYAYVIVSGLTATFTAVKEGTETITQTATLTACEEATHNLKISALFSSVKVEYDGEEILTADVPWLGEIDVSNVGALAKNGSVEVLLSGGGYDPYSRVTSGDWTFQGARINSWTETETGVKSSAVGGTTFKSTIALVATTKSTANGYYVSAEINNKELVGNEYKTGIMPYYKDGNNHVFVWLSQWAGAQTMITVTARLNGSAVGSEWRETPATFTIQNAVIYLEIYISGDTLKVYLNKAFAPVYSTTIDGLSNVEPAYVGVNAFGTATEFNNFQVTDERAQVQVGEPTIEVVGTMPSTGTVGKEIRLPVLSATGIAGSTANVEVVITDGANNVVEVANNRFTPATAGTYTIKVTASDAWGNTSEETYTITVSEPTTDSSNDSTATSEESSGGCMGSVNSTLALGMVMSVIAMAFIGSKRRNVR